MLNEYKKKRDFTKTPEPEGKKFLSGESPLFVVQKHKASHLHYDFRLEIDGVLKSWAIPKGPSLNPNEKRLAMMTEDHPYEYKDFEGIIPKGNYGAGEVIIWDEGNFLPVGVKSLKEAPKKLKEGLLRGELKIVLNGHKLKGEFVLVRTDENKWLLIKKEDDFASLNGPSLSERSVITGKTIEDIKSNSSRKWISDRRITNAPKENLPERIKPMLSSATDKPFNDPDWIFEVKLDGFRATAKVREEKIELLSRNNLSFNTLFPKIVESLKELKTDVVLDGEVVVLDEKGRSNFQLLQNYRLSGKGNALYFVFDILHLNGHNLRELPLVERKEILTKTITGIKNLFLVDHIEEKGVDFFNLAKENQIEGIMAKKKDSIYVPGKRTTDWLKIKSLSRHEAVIGGYTSPRGSRKELGALILGLNDENGLRYIGHTGGGFNEKSLKEIKQRLDRLRRNDSPFYQKFKTNEKAFWVDPKLVAEIEFNGWTNEGLMRQPIFLGLREDKNANEVGEEKTFKKIKDEITIHINDKELKLTNLSKIYWPEKGLMKAHLIDYYLRINKFILPYLKDRPISLHRHPNGVSYKAFWQKDITSSPSWAETIKIHSESENKDINYFLCQNKESLIYLANLGCIEMNPWLSKIGRLNFPDYFAIDLDPVEVPFSDVIETALTVKEVLDEVDVVSFCKTSGSKGIHVYVPLSGEVTYEQTKQFAEIVAKLVHRKIPKITSVERSPAKRRNKVYLDYLQNRKGQTLASAYSLRPVKDALVSTPLEWSEVKPGLDPKNFDIKTIFERLKTKGDIWKDMYKEGADLWDALKKFEKKEKLRILKN